MAKTKNNRPRAATGARRRGSMAFAELQVLQRQVETTSTALNGLLQRYPRAHHGQDWNPRADLRIQLRHAQTLLEEAAMMLKPLSASHVDVQLKAVRS